MHGWRFHFYVGPKESSDEVNIGFGPVKMTEGYEIELIYAVPEISAFEQGGMIRVFSDANLEKYHVWSETEDFVTTKQYG